MALDLADQHGPEVDAALGVPEPTVDLWEAGTVIPTTAQLARLAALTGVAVGFFSRPMPPRPERMILCQRGRGCEIVDTRPAAEVVPLYGQGVLF